MYFKCIFLREIFFKNDGVTSVFFAVTDVIANEKTKCTNKPIQMTNMQSKYCLQLF